MSTKPSNLIQFLQLKLHVRQRHPVSLVNFVISILVLIGADSHLIAIEEMEDQGFDGTLGVVLAETFARAESEGKKIISELWVIIVIDVVSILRGFCKCDYDEGWGSGRIHTSDGLMFSKRSGRKTALSSPQNGLRMLMAKASTVTSVWIGCV